MLFISNIFCILARDRVDILVRSPCNVNHTVDQGKSGPLVLGLWFKGDVPARRIVAGSRHGRGDGHWPAEFFDSRGHVERVKPLKHR